MKNTLLYAILLVCSLSQTVFGMHSNEFIARYPIQEYQPYYDKNGQWRIRLDYYNNSGTQYSVTINKEQLNNLCKEGQCNLFKQEENHYSFSCYTIFLPKDTSEAAIIAQYYHKALNKTV